MINHDCIYVSVHLSATAFKEWVDDVHVKLSEDPDYTSLMDDSPLDTITKVMGYYLDVFDENIDSSYRQEVIATLDELGFQLEMVTEIYFSSKDNFILLEIEN